MAIELKEHRAEVQNQVTEFASDVNGIQTGDFPVWAANNSRLLVEGEVRFSVRVEVRAFFIDFLVTPISLSPSSARGFCRSLGSCGIMLAARWSSSGCVTSLWTS